ncbi:hypothetical protein [Chromobacterium piscinae]|uniref:hypothetical protein n=1 Tax=Chromobacterium piscinae TaxID=686831 RepID=UPI00320A0094
MLPLHIFTEGGLSQGLGHLTRCLAYAHAWRELGRNVCWWVDGDKYASNLLLEESVTWGKWQEQCTAPNINAFGLVDSYSASSFVLDIIVKSHSKVIFLDDTFRIQYPKGYVVHATECDDVPEVVKGDSTWLIGKEWQALRPAFWRNFPAKNISFYVKNIFIMIGGTDHLNLTEKVCNELKAAHPYGMLHIVSNKKLHLENARFYNSLTDYEICDLMMMCDFSITSASQCIFELAKVGMPGIILATAQNQDQQLQVWSENGSFLSAGCWYKTAANEKLRECINNISSFDVRQYMSTISRMEMSGVSKPKALELLC